MAAHLHEWHEFYLLIGTAGAILVALLFVAVSLAVGSVNKQRASAIRVYMSPVVIHFTNLFFMSAIGLSAVNATLFAIVIGAASVVGLIVSAIVTARVMKDDAKEVVSFDIFAYGALPALSYALSLVAAVMAAGEHAWTLHLFAAALLTLLIINIRNSWDLMLTMVRRTSGPR